MSVSANELASTDMWRYIMKLACTRDEDLENFAGVCRLFHTLKKQHWEVLKRKYEEDFWPISHVFGNGEYQPRLLLLRSLSDEISKQIAIVRCEIEFGVKIEDECYKLLRLTYSVRSKHYVSKREHYFKKITALLYPQTRITNGHKRIKILMRSYVVESTETLVIASVISVQLFPSWNLIQRYSLMDRLLS